MQVSVDLMGGGQVSEEEAALTLGLSRPGKTSLLSSPFSLSLSSLCIIFSACPWIFMSQQ